MEPGHGNDDPLGLDADAMRALGYRVVDVLVERLAALESSCQHYNFARTHKSLRNPYPRTPAMAAGVSDQIWSLQEIAGLLAG